MNASRRVAGLAVAFLIGGCGAATGPALHPGAVMARVSSPRSTSAGAPSARSTSSDDGIPDGTTMSAYHSQRGTYEVLVPNGWARIDLPTGASFTDTRNTVRIETRAAPVPPTVNSARAQLNGVAISRLGTVVRKGGQAIMIAYRIDSLPDLVTGKVVKEHVERYIFYRPGLEAILTLWGPVSADNTGPWRTISDSFHWMA
ncbi:hypothetical protein ABZ897_41175 [Nonomuraea sp. NPDC046802]|uniref:hypothetical protein n=1 Tax=Nonomuraea sp. NPDC046802 TaxID=3154919 RepID=UPI003411D9FE